MGTGINPFRTQGFTLIELIVVMVILAIVAGVAVPALFSVQSETQLRSTARKLIGLINGAGQYAQSHSTACKLLYLPEEHKMVLRDTSLIALDPKAFPVRYQLTLAEEVEVENAVSWYSGTRSGTELVLDLSPRGYMDFTLLHLRHRNDASLTLALSPFLGVIRLYEGYVSIDDERFTYH